MQIRRMNSRCVAPCDAQSPLEDAPSRGHDLKLFYNPIVDTVADDAPSRGHDLKH